jgi:sulfide dehydrogenase [flavocytochrome c] flavoprotein subunit
MTRRNFIKTSSIAAMALMIAPMELVADENTAKVVIIGGGVAGSTVARYLRKFIPQSVLLEITIIEPKTTYTTPFGSNEVLTNSRTLAELTLDYSALEIEVGTRMVHQKAIALDSSTKEVTVADGTVYPYDYCIVATGIAFEYSDIIGVSESNIEQIPHAYDLYNDGSTEQITLLKNQLDAMADTATVVLVAPKNSYRCPPAPYERASQIAQYITEHKPNATVTILDPKTTFAKQDAFEKAWEELYGYKTASATISWKSETVVTQIAIDEATGKKTVTTESGTTIEADVVTYIPTMRASDFAYTAGLVQSGTGAFDMAERWCPIDHTTFESTMTDKSGIYIIGDSIRSNLPKSGYAANSEAKACATAIAAKIKGLTPIPESIITNGCYSFVGADYAISIFQKFKLSSDKTTYELVPQTRGTSPLVADATWRKKEVEQGHAWYANFRRDCFGV